MLVDSHCHLNYPEFKDLQATIAAADEAGVKMMLTISTKLSEFKDVIAIAEQAPNIYASIGIHPHEAQDHQNLSLDTLLDYSRHPKVIGIGETGLDYYYEHSPREAQQALFRLHIEASRISGLPLIVHSRDADEETVGILHEAYKQGPFTGLIHCFSSSEYLAVKSMEIGFYISIAGILTFKKSEALREMVRQFPLNRLLVETDSPYLAPEPYRGRSNQPAFTRLVAERMAAIKNISYEDVASNTSSNFFNLFSKVQRPHWA